jgi:spore germination cell wall hydrolase CwlJ-like protein
MDSVLAFSIIFAGVSLTPLSIEKSDNVEFLCLAKNIYHEAKNQSYSGMLGVGQVTINRTKSSYWPDNICDVVYEGAERKNKCQFSWTCDDRVDSVDFSSRAWSKALSAAHSTIGEHIDVVGEATHFHADYVSPYWATKLTRITKIDNHIFYKEQR